MKRITLYSLIVVIIIVASIITVLIWEDSQYRDRIEYGFEIRTNSTEIKYSIKFPIPFNWELKNDIENSEGNVTFTQTTETRIRNTFNGPEEYTLDYIEINGTGNSNITFVKEAKRISGIHFPNQDWPNNTMDVYSSIEPNNETLWYIFWFEEILSSVGPDAPGIGHSGEYLSKGYLKNVAWSKATIEITVS
jgi:hypothetical protein